jgi:adenine-specific DNA-methyltransferase
MPSLNWIGREAVYRHHTTVPFRLLHAEPQLSAGKPESGNLLVEGDNLLALKALLPYYAGQVKCIYLDPPYNTGKEKWTYNDNLNSPTTREWLGKAVGREAEDLSRHDKWLCMIYPRLALAKEFLSEDGIIFVSIDDNELPALRMTMDELFLAKNLLACFVWQTEGNYDNQAKVKVGHEYILAYARDYERLPPPPVIDPNIPEGSKLFKEDIRNTIVKNGPKNPVSDIVLPAGFPASFEEGTIPGRSDQWPQYAEDLIVKDSRLQNQVAARSGWSSKKICESFVKCGFKPVLDSKGQTTIFELTRTGAIEAVKVRPENQSHVVSVLRDVGTTQQMSVMLAQMGITFDYPKPVGLVQYLISMIADKNCTVLDSFAGSGTTGHAVLQLNKEDGGSRHFVLVEMEPHIAAPITATRLRHVIEGYSDTEGLGGGFQYCTLGVTLFDAEGRIRPEVSFAELARFIYFIQTGTALPKERADGPLLGINNNTAIYLLYNGILKDKRANGGNALTRRVLTTLPPHNGPRVIYGTRCLLGEERLRREAITFMHIPTDLRVE